MPVSLHGAQLLMWVHLEHQQNAILEVLLPSFIQPAEKSDDSRAADELEHDTHIETLQDEGTG
jgi:hypothetical protein